MVPQDLKTSCQECSNGATTRLAYEPNSTQLLFSLSSGFLDRYQLSLMIRIFDIYVERLFGDCTDKMAPPIAGSLEVLDG